MKWSVLLAAVVNVAAASQIQSFVGALNPNDPNNVFLAPLTLSSLSQVTIQTYGYGGTANAPGGTNGAGQAIAPGGFAPYLAIYAGAGSAAVFFAFSEAASCPPGAPKAGSCFDVSLSVPQLGAGTYIVAVGTRGNEPAATVNPSFDTLGSGFLAGGHYTDPSGGGVLTSNYAMDVRVTTLAPEPGTAAGAAVGLLLLAACARRAATRRR